MAHLRIWLNIYKEVFQPEIEMALETLNSGEVEDSVQ